MTEQPKVFVGTMEYPYGRMIMHHMSSPDIEALHKMADSLGLKREWFQGTGNNKLCPHYDISKSKKSEALRLGAIEVSDKELIRQCYPVLKSWMDGEPISVQS